ncbi:hypothetical protein [Photobacterium kishitanii]|nr:hypothetical protein [Photobacterium kishitanii]
MSLKEASGTLYNTTTVIPQRVVSDGGWVQKKRQAYTHRFLINLGTRNPA